MPTPEADRQQMAGQPGRRLQAQVSTAQMGVITGYTHYAVVDTGTWLFALMHEDAHSFTQLKAYWEALPSSQ